MLQLGFNTGHFSPCPLQPVGRLVSSHAEVLVAATGCWGNGQRDRDGASGSWHGAGDIEMTAKEERSQMKIAA